MELKHRKGQGAAIAGATGLISLAIVMVIYAIVSSYGGEIVSDVRDDMGDAACSGYFNLTSQICQVNTTNQTQLSANPVEYNVSQNSLTGLSETAEKMPTIGRITVAAIIITIILGAFGAFVALR